MNVRKCLLLYLLKRLEIDEGGETRTGFVHLLFNSLVWTSGTLNENSE